MNGTISLQSKLKGAVSMANTIINGGASPYPKTVGPAAIASFTDGAQDAPLKSLVFDIEPVQSGSGDPSPTNIRPISGWTQVDGYADGVNIISTDILINGYHYNASGVLESNANRSSTPKIKCASRDSIAISWESDVSLTQAIRCIWDENGNLLDRVVPTATIEDNRRGYVTNLSQFSGAFYIGFSFYASSSVVGHIDRPMIAFGSSLATYTAPTITPITIPLGQTVYGGTLDVVRGKLNVKPYYASYSGQTLVGPWISSHDKYVAGATPTTGAQVVDMGAAGTDYDVTPQTIKTLLGVNNIWADCGDTTLEYYPAAASIVSVLNRSSKVYTSIPLGKIRYETYQITPQQTIDLDSYRSENGNLLRNPVATKCKIEFNTPLMTDSEWAGVWKIIKAGFNNNTERKLKLRYYDTLSATYKTGYFYVPDVQTTIRNIEEGAGVINYNEIRIAFIEY
jgi:hypothetical protein